MEAVLMQDCNAGIRGIAGDHCSHWISARQRLALARMKF